jgi:hypothetical protein
MEKMFDECKVYVSSGTVAASNIANKFRAWALHCGGQHASSPLVACGCNTLQEKLRPGGEHRETEASAVPEENEEATEKNGRN